MKKVTLPRLRALLAGVAVTAAHGAFAASTVVYDSIPSPMPGNVPSLGFEARSTIAVGDAVELAPGERTLSSFDVLMSSWACVEGGWNTGDCATPPGARFPQAITLTLFGEDQQQMLGSATKVFDIPYRPSADPACGDGRWMDANGVCNNGFGNEIRFTGADFGNLTLPDRFLYSVSFNTRSHGPMPTGVPGPADSLNVGLRAVATYGVALPIGSDPNGPTAIYQNTRFGGFYCDGGTGGVGVYRLDAGCWNHYVAARVTTAPAPEAVTVTAAPRGPLDAPPVVNTTTSALPIPVRFSVTRASDGSPVTDLGSVNITATTVDCAVFAGAPRDRVEQVALLPGRLINRGFGNYQFNYGVERGTTGCRVIAVSLPEGFASATQPQFFIEYLR